MASTVVEVTDQDLEGLTLVLGSGAEISGRIVTDRQDSDLDWRANPVVYGPGKQRRQRIFRWRESPG